MWESCILLNPTVWSVSSCEFELLTVIHQHMYIYGGSRNVVTGTQSSLLFGHPDNQWVAWPKGSFTSCKKTSKPVAPGGSDPCGESVGPTRPSLWKDSSLKAVILTGESLKWTQVGQLTPKLPTMPVYFCTAFRYRSAAGQQQQSKSTCQ